MPEPIDPGVDIGHVHLKVADLDRALAFYCDVLGFELQQRLGEEAAFVSAGGYHHHIGLNTWHSKGGSPAAAEQYRPLPPGDPLPDPPRPRRSPAAPGRQRRPPRRRLRPRRQRGALPGGPRPQRDRALLGPAQGGVAAAGAGGEGGDVHAPPRPARPARRTRAIEAPQPAAGEGETAADPRRHERDQHTKY